MDKASNDLPASDHVIPDVDPRLLYLNAPLVLGHLARVCRAAADTLESGKPTKSLRLAFGDATALILKLLKQSDEKPQIKSVT